MLQSYNGVVCPEPASSATATRAKLNSNAPAGAPLSVHSFMVQAFYSNTGHLWLVDSLTAAPLASPPTGVLACIGVPTPAIIPAVKVTVEYAPAAATVAGDVGGGPYLMAEVPGEGAYVSVQRS